MASYSGTIAVCKDSCKTQWSVAKHTRHFLANCCPSVSLSSSSSSANQNLNPVQCQWQYQQRQFGSNSKSKKKTHRNKASGYKMPPKLQKKDLKQQGDFPLLVPITSLQRKTGFDPYAMSSKVRDLEEVAPATATAGVEVGGSLPWSMKLKLRPPKPHEVRSIVREQNQALKKWEEDYAESFDSKDKLSMQDLQNRNISKKQQKLNQSKSREDAYLESLVDKIPEISPMEMQWMHAQKDKDENRWQWDKYSSNKILSDQKRWNYEQTASPFGGDSDPTSALQQIGKYRKDQVHWDGVTRQDKFFNGNDDGQNINLLRQQKTTPLKSVNHNAEFYSSFFRDRDRRLDGGKQKEFNEILKQLPDPELGEDGNRHGKSWKVRISPREWWGYGKYSAYNHADEEEARRTTVCHAADVGFMKAGELKKVMLFEAHRMRKHKIGVFDAEQEDSRQLWTSFTKRGYELSTGRLFPGGQPVTPCHPRSIMRFLQAIASVQFYPKEGDSNDGFGSGELLGVLGGQPQQGWGPQFSFADGFSESQYCITGRKQTIQWENQSLINEGSTNTATATGSSVVSSNDVQHFIHSMLHQCLASGTMKQQHYFFLFQVCSRLRLRDLQKQQMMLQKMSVCWSLLPSKQLIKVANAVWKLDLAKMAWTKPLQKALEAQLLHESNIYQSQSEQAAAGLGGRSWLQFADEESLQQLKTQLLIKPKLLMQLKAVTILEFVEHRLVEVVELMVEHQRKELNIRSLVLLEMYLRLQYPDLYKNGLKASTRRELEEFRVKWENTNQYKQDDSGSKDQDQSRPRDDVYRQSIFDQKQWIQSISKQKLKGRMRTKHMREQWKRQWDDHWVDNASTEMKQQQDEATNFKAYLQNKNKTNSRLSPNEDDHDSWEIEEETNNNYEQDEIAHESGKSFYGSTSISNSVSLQRCEKLLKYIKSELDSQNLNYKTRVKAGPFVLDIFVPSENLVIEVLPDWCYYNYEGGGAHLTSSTKWRHKFIRLMGFQLEVVPHFTASYYRMDLAGRRKKSKMNQDQKLITADGQVDSLFPEIEID